MSHTQKVRRIGWVVATLGVGVWSGLAPAAVNNSLDINNTGTGSGISSSGGTYSWEDPIWNPATAGTSATGAYQDGTTGNAGFPRFAAGTDAAFSYTVTANSNHLTAGMFLEDGFVGSTVTLNGTGTLNIDDGGTGAQQGFIVRGGSNLKILNVVGGAGGINFQTSGGTGAGSLFLYGQNTYAGGTLLNTGGGLNFNNNKSFGTGTITWNVAAPVLAAPDATGPVTIANDMNTRAASTLTVTSAAVAPVTFSGHWTLVNSALSTVAIGNATFPNSVMTISGAITGTGSSFAKSGTGTLVLSSTGNTYDGTTTVTAGRLKMGVPNAIASTGQLVLGGGIFDPGGFTQDMSIQTLALTANSTIDYGSGVTEIDFADSSSVGWTGILNLANWNYGTDKLRFGTSDTTLSSGQLSQIEFNGVGLGTASLTPDGYVVPEPSSACVLLLAMPLMLRRRRSRVAGASNA